MRLELEYPGIPPSANHLYVTNRSGRRFLTTEGKAFKRRLIAHLAQTYGAEIAKLNPLGVYTVGFYGYYDPKRILNPTFGKKGGAKKPYKRFDASNRIKIFEDAVAEVLAIDDSSSFAVGAGKYSSALCGGVEKIVAIIEERAIKEFGF
jgi:hypothetical protein